MNENHIVDTNKKVEQLGDGNRKANALVRPDLAKDFHLKGLAMSCKGLAMSWMSTALFKMGDSWLVDDEVEAQCLRREARAFETCSDSLTINIK